MIIRNKIIDSLTYDEYPMILERFNRIHLFHIFKKLFNERSLGVKYNYKDLQKDYFVGKTHPDNLSLADI